MAKEDYFDTRIPLVAQPSESGEIFIDIGEHNYPFEFDLPVNLPTSFKHDFGNISYMLTATIDVPWSFNKHSVKHFTVLSQCDLNGHPELSRPVKANDSKKMSLFGGKNASMTIELNLNKSGFVCSERLPFTAMIDNKSDQEIGSRIALLVQKMRFNANGISKDFERTVASVAHYGDRVTAKSTDKWSDHSIVIPAVCPSTSPNTCRIIEVSYELHFVYRQAGIFHNNHKIAVPIVIATLPFRDESYDAPPPYSFEANYFSQEDQKEAQKPAEFEFKQNDEVFHSDNDKGLKLQYPYYSKLAEEKLLNA
jgi:hypothetical protein